MSLNYLLGQPGAYVLSRHGLFCERCGRNLSQVWEKPGDLAYDGPLIILPRDDVTDTYWCSDCYPEVA